MAERSEPRGAPLVPGFLADALRSRERAGVHPALWMTRFALHLGDKIDKKGSLERACQHAASFSGIVAGAVTRREAWTRSLGSRAESFRLQTRSRLLVGLGAATPLEIGFTLHHLYGCGVLPGSSLKGLARAVARECEGEEVERRLFGDQASAGTIDFLDALPERAELVLDILNPHYPDYYAGKAEVAHDSESPVPNHFLAVPEGVPFRFDVVSRGASEADLKLAAALLRDGLTIVGAGAKTTAGYGVFEEVGAQPADGGRPMAVAAPPRHVKQGDVVKAELLEEKTAKGGWKAKAIDIGLAGPVHVSGSAPAEWQAGEVVQLEVFSLPAGGGKIEFRYPPVARTGGPPKGGRKNPGSPGWKR